MTGDTAEGVRARLQSELRVAMKARDASAVAVLRTTLATIANAEAVDAPGGRSSAITSGPIAGAVSGLGAAEVARRELSEADVAALVQREIDDRVAAAREYDGLGRTAEAAGLRAQCDVLRRVLG